MKLKSIVCGMIACSVIACGGGETERDSKTQPTIEHDLKARAVNAPSYVLTGTRDVSFPGAVRKVFQVRVDRQNTADVQFSKDDAIKVAAGIIAKNCFPPNPRVNAAAVHIQFHGRRADSVADYTVNWAPNGEWGNANTVRAGDYDTFKLLIDFEGVEINDQVEKAFPR